jgi:hypothetical protein
MPFAPGPLTRYADELDLSVVPLRPRSKKPAVKWTPYRSARATAAELALWDADPSGLGVAAVAGQLSGIVVLDIDEPAKFRAWLDAHGHALPPTWRSRTGRGEHVFFRHPGTVAKSIVPISGAGAEILADNHLVTLPPSVHPDTGRPYAWLTAPPGWPGEDDTAPLAACPPWLCGLLAPAASPAPSCPTPAVAPSGYCPIRLAHYAAAALTNEEEEVRSAPQGDRNHTLNIAAFSLGQLVGAGALDRKTVHDHLLAAALACGLPRREAEATIKSGLDAGVAQPRDLSAIDALWGLADDWTAKRYFQDEPYAEKELKAWREKVRRRAGPTRSAPALLALAGALIKAARYGRTRAACFPSLERLVAWSGLPKTTLRRHLGQLETWRLLHRFRPWHGDRWSPTFYTLTADEPAWDAAQQRADAIMSVLASAPANAC